MSPQVLLVCGLGGVGKTTSAAVLALAWAARGQRTVVLTIDPARRLADALGVQLADVPTPVHVPGHPDARLDALMLDRRAAWSALVRRHLTHPARADALLANPYFQALSERLSGGHEFMAIETLHQLAASGRYDLIVVDTPPSQHALDVLAAPERIQRILDQRLLGALLRPASGLLGAATRGLTDVVRRLAGDAMIDDLRTFFDLVGPVSHGLRDDSAAVAALLATPGARAVMVRSALSPDDAETAALLAGLRGHGLSFAGFILNRATLPGGPADLTRPPSPPPPGVDPGAWVAEMEALTRWARARARRAEGTRRVAAALRRDHGAPVALLADHPAGLLDLPALVDAAADLGDTLP
jgi:arsenite-transporting ATPase